jgi:hypothetical protein
MLHKDLLAKHKQDTILRSYIKTAANEKDSTYFGNSQLLPNWLIANWLTLLITLYALLAPHWFPPIDIFFVFQSFCWIDRQTLD